MLLIQLTGLPGSGKTTLAYAVKAVLISKGFNAEVVDGDEYRKHLCKDLSFSKADREENIRRLGVVSNQLVSNGIITLMSAINPFEASRQKIKAFGNYVKTVWINCSMDTLITRDPKGLYKRALLPEGHPDKLYNLTGVDDLYEAPTAYDLLIDTTQLSEDACTKILADYILEELK